MKRVAFAASSLVLACAAQAHVPAGWTAIHGQKGPCHMAVPADWKQGELMGKKLSIARAPDKSADAVVNTMVDTDWSAFHGMIYSVYTKEKDRPKMEDTPKRLVFDIVSMPSPGKTSWYVATPAGGSTCHAQINFRKGDAKAEETARKIVQTVGQG